MKLITKQNNFHLLRIDPGEDAIEELKKYCLTNAISAGSFQAMGAAGSLILSFYNLETKEYEDHVVDEDVEIASMVGNIVMMKNDLIIHSHGVFSKRDFSTIGGHIKSLTISATCEISLTSLKSTIERSFDPHTGLNLLS